MRFVRTTLCVLLMIPLLAGCSRRMPADSEPSAEPIHSESAGRLDYFPYQVVLEKYVDKGQVRYCSLKKNARPLEDFVASLARVGPRGTPAALPTPESRLAFWINAHNAAVLDAAVRAFPVKTVFSPWHEFSDTVQVRVDGSNMTLAQIAERARQAGGQDPRVELALILPAVGSGQVPSTPYRADRIQEQLNAAVKRALDDSNLVMIDHEEKTLWLGRPLFRVRQRYIDIYSRTYHTENASILNALAAYADANQRRRLNAALGYRVAELKFDESLNVRDEPACLLDQWGPASKN